MGVDTAVDESRDIATVGRTVTEAGANSLILTSAFVTAGSTMARSMLPESQGGRAELPAPRIVIGTAVAFTALAMMAPFAPNFAGMWALLMMVVSLLDNGAPLLNSFLGITKQKGKKK